ncbi:hypothetical protein [Brucella anthropi]|uniref:hypothetical protein n=1 Tax=Brucella anthropi TaxID=529 RepID=UPI003D95BF6D
MGKMTLEDRWQRDGERWRYIYLLEMELEQVQKANTLLKLLFLLPLAIIIWQAV